MLRALFAIVLATGIIGCVTDESGPDDTELAELDQWAETADGKADLPSTWTELVAWLRDFYKNDMSAIWNRQEHPASADAAIARVRALAGNRRLFPTTVQRLRTELIDHSEINIAIAPGRVVRLVGDPKGAGAFLDGALFRETVGPRMCLTWEELETAIRASYAPGAYAVDFVCHTITERVLRALGAGSARYAAQVRTYAAARWTWGPVLPSGNSHDPADWPMSRACPN